MSETEKKTAAVSQLLSKKEIAFRIGKSPRTVSRWARSGMLPKPAKVVGKREYWLVSQIPFLDDYKTFEDTREMS